MIHHTSTDRHPSQAQAKPRLRHFLLDIVNGRRHRQVLIAYMFIATGHLGEHLVQVAQVYLLGWAPGEAGGVLGLWFSGLAASEVLHSAYNSFQLTGLILLLPGFRNKGHARLWWTVALAAQSWHWLEHAFLQVQYLTGHYFYGALKQISVLERFVPRVELHFAYNLLVFIPTVVALVLYLRHSKRRK